MIVDAIKRCLMIVWNFFFGQISSESIQDGAAKRDEQPAATDSSFGSARDDNQACDDGADDGIDDEDDVEVAFDDDDDDDDEENENEDEDEDDREEPVPSRKTDGQPAEKNVDIETPPSPKAVAPQRTEDAPEPKKPEAPEPKKSEAPEPKKSEAPEPKKSEAPEPKKPEAPEPKKPEAPASEAPEPKRSEAPEPKKAEAPEPPKRPAAEEAKPPQGAAADDVKTPEKARAHVKFEDDEPEKKKEDDPNARFVRSEKGDATKPHPSPAAASVDAFLAGEQKRAVQENHPPQLQHPREHPPETIQDQTL